MTDGELVRQIRDGSVTAYGPLSRRWAAHVMAVCHARVGKGAAEDLAQEALLRGLRALPTLSDPEKFGPWLTGIAVRTCLDWLKSSKRSEVSLDSLVSAGAGGLTAPQDSADADRFERAELLMDEVERLPPIYREVILHYYYGDCTYQELAVLLGLSTAAINARLTKARAMLRERMMTFRD